MPKIPVYEQQLNAPRGAALDVSSAATYLPFANQVSNTGAMVEQQGARLLQEYDTTLAYAAFNELRDKSRNKMAELLSREGSAAQGAQREYTDFYQKAKEDVAKNSTTAFSQRQLFDKLSLSHQQGDLDNLARHEYTEHKKNIVSVVSGFVATTERDIRENVNDDAKMNGMIYGQTEADRTVTPGLWGAIDALGTGIDRTAAKLEATQKARYAAADELINTNPKRAAIKLEEWKTELGEKYAPLKKRLETQRQDTMLGDAFGGLNAKFGNNHEAKIAYVNNKDNWSQFGPDFDYKHAKELDARFSGMAADRERAINAGINAVERQQKTNATAVLQSLYNPNAPKVDYHELHRRRLIDDETYKHAVTPRDTAKNDNPFVFADLHDKINRGLDVTKEVAAAVDDGSLSKQTAGSVLKTQTDEKYKREAANIARVMKPSDLDFSQDKRNVFGEAMRLFDSKLASGMSYEQAGVEVRAVFLDDLRRSVKNVPTPEGITHEQKSDLAQLENARAILVAKRKVISPSEYRERMAHIDSLVKIAIDNQEAEKSNELVDLLRKQGKIAK